jgi:elongation factor Ts
VKDIAMHIAAAAPICVKREEVPADLIARELEIARGQAREQKKPEAIIEKIATGKIEKYYSEICLLEQPFVKDDKKKIQDVITEAVAKIGENIQVRRFSRFVLGEGLEKKTGDFAAEVAAAAGLAK